MSFSLSDVVYDIEPQPYTDKTWGFKIRYWLHGTDSSSTTWVLFTETFPTEEKMREQAARAAVTYLQDHQGILEKLIGLLATDPQPRRR